MMPLTSNTGADSMLDRLARKESSSTSVQSDTYRQMIEDMPIAVMLCNLADFGIILNP